MARKKNLYISVLLLICLLVSNNFQLRADNCTIIDVDQTAISFDHTGGTQSVLLDLSCGRGSTPIEAIVVDAWISVTVPPVCTPTAVCSDYISIICEPNPDIQSVRTTIIQFSESSHTITVTQNACDLPPMPGVISGLSEVCSGATEIFSIVDEGIDYEWEGPSGSTMIEGQGTNTVTIQFGDNSRRVIVRGINDCGYSSDRIKDVAIIDDIPDVPPGSITGSLIVCAGSEETYTIVHGPGRPPEIFYDWSVPEGATITSEPDSTAITVLFGSISGDVKVRAKDSICSNLVSAYVSMSVELVDRDHMINGIVSDTGKCEGENVSFQVNVNGTGYSYQWQQKAPGDPEFSDCSGQSVTTATLTTSSDVDGMQYQCVVSKGSCSNITNIATLRVYPTISITVDPTDTYILPNENVEITASGADFYEWVPATGLSSTTDATVIAGPTQTTEYTVTGTSNLICSDTKIVIVNQIELMGGKIEFSESESELTVIPTGGEPPYTYFWSGGGGFAETTPVGASGTYTVTITDYRENELSLAYYYSGAPTTSNSAVDILKKNYIKTKVYNEAGTLIGASAKYANSMGKPIQTQSKNFTDDKTMVTQTIYDAMGRPAVSTLAAPVEDTEFAYKTGFITNSYGDDYSYLDFDGINGEKLISPNKVNNAIPNTLGSYYSDNNFAEPYVAATEFPYSRVEYSKSNPGQTRKRSMPGEAHKMGSGREVQSYSMPAFNEELQLFSTNIPEIEYKGLIKTISVDTEGKEAISYTSSEGHSIASCLSDGPIQRSVTKIIGEEGRGHFSYIDIHIPKGCDPTTSIVAGPGPVIIDLTTDEVLDAITSPGFYRISVEGEVEITHNVNYYNHAINVYDELGRLKKSYSPKSIEEGHYDNMVATYKYNSLGWLLESSDPDIGVSHFVYQRDGNIRFSQNEQQKIDGKFSYTNYDDAGRIAEVGEYTYKDCSECLVFETHDEYKFSQNPLSVHTILEDIYSPTDSLADGLDDVDCEYQSFTQYDLADENFELSGYTQKFLLGKVSKTWNKNTTTWYSYLYDGKVDWVVQEIDIPEDDETFGKVTIDYTYDAAGNVDTVMYQKDIYIERFDHVYAYDADNRLKEVRTLEYDTLGFVKNTKLQARYFYYQHGSLKRTELADGLQGIDYVYNINGWLKSINHPNLTVGDDPGKDGHAYSAVPEDIFGMSLDYYNGDYSRTGTNITSVGDLYNGNIHTQRWQTRADEAPALPTAATQWATQYSYDKRNWLTQALFGTIGFDGISFTADAEDAYKVSGLTYDANGNLMALNRNAISMTVEGTTSTRDMDQFEYKYYGTKNQMKQLVDLNNKPSDLDDIKPGQEEFNYEYDSIGQMVANHQEGHYFEYDVYGKVTAVYEDEAHIVPLVYYDYNESGFRIKKTDVKNSKDTYYIRDASGSILSIYERDGIGVILQTELLVYAASRIGVAYKNETGIDKFTYELTDHLGTVRATFTEGTTSEPEVLSFTDYYPFGMVMPGRNHVSNKYRFGYQGQFAEKDEETGYNQFQLRLYDARVGRWLTTDPMNQYWSPYMAMGNNPMRINDPTGGEGEETVNVDGFDGVLIGEVVCTSGSNVNNSGDESTGGDKWHAGNYYTSEGYLNNVKKSRPSRDFFPEISRTGGSSGQSEGRNNYVYRDTNGNLTAVRPKNSGAIYYYSDAIDDSLEYWTDTRKFFLKLVHGGYFKPAHQMPDSITSSTGKKVHEAFDLIDFLLND